MQPHGMSPPARRVALFDLDGTLTWHDTLAGFLTGYLLRHPSKWRRLWRAPISAARYLCGAHDRGALKSAAIRIVMGGESRAQIDSWADGFVAGLKSRGTFRPTALSVLEQHRQAGDHLVLLSASPDLYVPRIGRLLGFERTVCTGIAWTDDVLEGSLATPNRRGAEKSACLAALRLQYPGSRFMAYGNSASDLPHLRLADAALLVNADAAAQREAADLGVPVAEWS